MEKLRHSPDNNSPEASELLLHQSQGRSPLSDCGTLCLRVPAHTPREGVVLRKEFSLSLNIILYISFPRSDISANNRTA